CPVRPLAVLMVLAACSPLLNEQVAHTPATLFVSAMPSDEQVLIKALDVAAGRYRDREGNNAGPSERVEEASARSVCDAMPKVRIKDWIGALDFAQTATRGAGFRIKIASVAVDSHYLAANLTNYWFIEILPNSVTDVSQIKSRFKNGQAAGFSGEIVMRY